MNKRLISFLLCLVLFFSITICAFASTDISKIQPDTYYGSVVIIGETYHEPNAVVINYDKYTKTTIIYPVYVPETIYEEVYIEENNNTEQKNTNNNTNNNTSEEGAYAPTKLAEDIFILVNQARMDAEVNTVSYNNKDLQDAADLRAKEIAEKFEHTRPDGTDCFTAFPKDYVVAGENIIQADEPIATANNMMNSWMESEGHRKNILLADFTQMAVGIYEKDGVVYAAQLFIG